MLSSKFALQIKLVMAIGNCIDGHSVSITDLCALKCTTGYSKLQHIACTSIYCIVIVPVVYITLRYVMM